MWTVGLLVAVLKAEIRKPTLAEHRMHDKVTKCIAVAEMDSTLSASSYGVLYEALNTTSTSPHIKPQLRSFRRATL